LHGQTSISRGLDRAGADYYFRPIVKYDFKYCEWGIEKTCFYGGDFPEEETRPPLLFPNMLRIPEGKNENLHWRIPVDDTHTRLIVMSFRHGEKNEENIPVEYLPSDITADGEYSMNSFFSQDRMAWETQGPILDRGLENLGASDRGVVMFRRLLEQQIKVVEQGGEPVALVRDPEKNRIIEFNTHSVNVLDKSKHAVPAHHD
jgi:5,5'-dehydrodivanillate O-demethylase